MFNEPSAKYIVCVQASGEKNPDLSKCHNANFELPKSVFLDIKIRNNVISLNCCILRILI